MAFAFWVVGAWFFIVVFGTLALQLLILLIQAAVFLLGWAATIAAGLIGTAYLAVFDRAELKRIWREPAAQGAVTATLARERWS